MSAPEVTQKGMPQNPEMGLEQDQEQAQDQAMRSGPEALIIGVGNLLWADEGFGVRAVEAFRAAYAVPESVEVMDGGTTGLALIPDLAAAKRILIFDAVDFDGVPGSLVVVRGDKVPVFAAGKKMSLHQTSMMEILALAEVMADGPVLDITLIGCQPCDMEDYGGGLTPDVSAQVGPAIQAAAEEVNSWGLSCTVRDGVLDPEAGLMPEAVLRAAYEEGRPDEAAACRIGDERVLVAYGDTSRSAESAGSRERA